MKNFHVRYVFRLLGIMAAVIALSFFLVEAGIGKESILMLFITGVLLVSYFTYGYIYGILSSIVFVLVFNFLFTQPVQSFSISNKNDVILLIFFLFAALISSNLTAKFQKQLKVAKENEELAGRLSAEQEKMQFAMEKEQLRSTLLRGISHDLRTPLTVIAGASSLIAESDTKLDRENVISLAKDINDQSEWLIRLVENILNMTRIDSGNMILEKKPEAVADVINNAVRRVKGRCFGRTLHICIPEDIFMVEMDGKTIVQVLINLLDNAIKHTQEHGEITVRLEHRVDYIWFFVEDNGTGIDESRKDNLFDEFVTARNPVQDAERGIGLGLAICRAVITAHGGEIIIENREEGGARIGFSLPFKEQKDYGEECYGSGC